MNININTKYDIGNKVYAIARNGIDYFNNKYYWIIVTDTNIFSERSPVIPLEIEYIQIKQFKKTFKVYYKIQEHLYMEEDMYTDLKEAERECERRNNI